MIDTGQGSPIVLIPGMQGRWEWMTPTVEALSAHHRTFSFSLDDVDAAKAPDARVRRVGGGDRSPARSRGREAGGDRGRVVRRPGRRVLRRAPAEPRLVARADLRPGAALAVGPPDGEVHQPPAPRVPDLRGARGGPLASGVPGAGRATGPAAPVSDAASGPRDAIPGVTDVHGRVGPRLGGDGHHRGVPPHHRAHARHHGRARSRSRRARRRDAGVPDAHSRRPSHDARAHGSSRRDLAAARVGGARDRSSSRAARRRPRRPRSTR